MAWLNAKPEEGEATRRKEFEAKNQEVVMPYCDASYVIDYLFDLGVTLGDAPINHQEIRAWMENTGIELDTWEARTIKFLSEAYLSMTHEATKIDSETPWLDAPFYMSANYRKSMRVRDSIRKAATI